jgi:tRNA(fMet)-specific endonuclease VapC
MRVAVDTNAYTAFCRGSPKASSVIKHAEDVVLPFIVLAELRAGFACGTKGKDNERLFSQFLNTPRVSVLYPDGQTTHHYARLFFQLRRQGTPIPTNDLWIAAVVTQHNLTLLTTDHHFEHLPQIPIIM